MSDYRAYDREDDRRERGSYYYDDREEDPRPRRHKSTRTRPRERGEPDFVEETTFVERGKGRPPTDLIPHPREREDSIEEIPRDFPPPSSKSIRGYRDERDYLDDRGPPPRRARSAYSRRDSYDDDYDDYAGPAAGAAAGYAAGRASRRGRDRGGGRHRRDRSSDGYYSDDYERYSEHRGSRSPPRHERKKSGIEGALEGLGLGGIAGALTGKAAAGGSRSRSRHGGGRSRSRSDSRSRTRTKGEKQQRQWAQAAQAAIVAGAVEAFRTRNEPGPWTGEKGRRIATAAIGAGGIDRIADRNPDKKSKMHLAEAVIGGLAANRLANGPRDKGNYDERGRSRSRSTFRSRSRSIIDRFRSKSRGRSVDPDGSPDRHRSKSRGGALGGLAAGGALAAAGKAIYDRVRSKSRGADKNRRRSLSRSDSEEGYGRSRNHDRRDVGSRGAGGKEAGLVAGEGAIRSGGEKRRSRSSSSSSSESDTDLENKRKKMRGKEFLTAGLASIATIHAAHGVYQSMEASEKRHKLVAEGEMSPEEARKKRSKAWLQDAAAVGIAALGIKGAYSEWKEMNEQRHSVLELEERRRARQKRREKRMAEARKSGAKMSGGLSGGGPPGGPLPPPDDYYGGGGHGGGQYAGDLPPPPPMGTATNGGYR